MGRHFHCTDEIIVVSKGREDIGKVPALGNDGKLDPSVIPEMGSVAIAGLAKASGITSIPCNVPDNEVPVQEVLFDQGEFFATDGKVHIKSSGVYSIAAQMYYEYQKPTGTAWVDIRVNGNKVAVGSTCPSTVSQAVAPVTAVIVKLNQGDVISMHGTASGSTQTNLTVVPESSQLSIARLGD